MIQPKSPRSDKTGSLENQIHQDIGSNQGQAIGQMYGGQAVDAGMFISAEHVVVRNVQGEDPSQSLLSIQRAIPLLLPYLPNRNVQEFELCQVMQTISREQLRHPLICIVHGDEYQSHDTFFQRLCEISLPRALGLGSSQSSIKKYHLLGWRPASLRSLQSIPERLCKCLSDIVENQSQAPVEKINQTFSSYPGPVLVEMHLLTEDWQRFGDGLLPKILEFWRSWPVLAPDQTLVVCLFVKYQIRQAGLKTSWRWLIKPIALLRRWLDTRRCRKLNLKIAQQVELISEGFYSSEHQHSIHRCEVVLPKLENITQSHVEEWVRCQETQAFTGTAGLGQLMNAVRNMADQCETMSMDHVAQRLIELLKETTNNNRRKP